MGFGSGVWGWGSMFQGGFDVVFQITYGQYNPFLHHPFNLHCLFHISRIRCVREFGVLNAQIEKWTHFFEVTRDKNTPKGWMGRVSDHQGTFSFRSHRKEALVHLSLYTSWQEIKVVPIKWLLFFLLKKRWEKVIR